MGDDSLRAGGRRGVTSSAPVGLYVMLGMSGLILVLLVLHILGGGLNHH
jgi:hypothetical protein